MKGGWNGVMLAALAVVVVGGEVYRKRCADRDRTAAVRREERFFETLDGRQAAHSEWLTLRMRELEGLLPELTEQIGRMRIDLKRVEQVQVTAMRSSARFRTALRDSLVTVPRNAGEGPVQLGDTMRGEPPDTVRMRVFDFANDYLRVKGMARGDSQWVRLEMRDTLIQVVHRGKRIRPWLWFFSPRELLQTVRLGNPDAEIRYSRRIEISP